VEFHQHAAAAARPVIALRIELAARRPAMMAAVGLEHLAGPGVGDDDAVTRPGPAAEIAAVPAHRAAIGAGKLFRGIAPPDVAGERIDLGHRLAARAPDEAVGVDGVVAAHRRVHRLRYLPLDALELLGLRIEAPDAVLPVFRAPHDVVLVHVDPMRAGERTRIDLRHAIFLDRAGARIEPADIGAAMRAVPDVAFRIAAHVVGGELKARQLVFGDDDPGLPPLRPRQRDERRILRLRPAHGGEPLHQARFLVLAGETAALVHVDERRAGAMGHAIDDLLPAVL